MAPDLLGWDMQHLGPISLRLYELVYRIVAHKQEFLVYFHALSHRNLRGFELVNSRVPSETGPREQCSTKLFYYNCLNLKPRHK